MKSNKGKFDIEKGIAAPDLIKNMQKQMNVDRKKTIQEMLSSAKNIKSADSLIAVLNANKNNKEVEVECSEKWIEIMSDENLIVSQSKDND